MIFFGASDRELLTAAVLRQSGAKQKKAPNNFWPRVLSASQSFKMAAGENEEEDEVCISTTTSPHKSHDEEIRREDGPGVSYSDYLCPICLQIIVEPVVMPCKHELCRPCFKKNVEEANLRCPLCRIRISSWARKQARNGTLVHRKRWEQIQRLFPERCEKRLRGEDDDDDLGE